MTTTAPLLEDDFLPMNHHRLEINGRVALLETTKEIPQEQITGGVHYPGYLSPVRIPYRILQPAAIDLGTCRRLAEESIVYAIFHNEYAGMLERDEEDPNDIDIAWKLLNVDRYKADIECD